LADRLKTGLTEAVQFAKGELTLRTVEVPTPPPEVVAKDVTSLRAKAGMSQAVFARVLNVSTKTVQSWEQGERKPSHAALRMLQVLREKPMFVFEIVGIPARDRGQMGCQASKPCCERWSKCGKTARTSRTQR
jgi:putative transcriptional regulator